MLLYPLGNARRGISLVPGPLRHCTTRFRDHIHRPGESQSH